jgi:hypothetical protein
LSPIPDHTSGISPSQCDKKQLDLPGLPCKPLSPDTWQRLDGTPLTNVSLHSHFPTCGAGTPTVQRQ